MRASASEAASTGAQGPASQGCSLAAAAIATLKIQIAALWITVTQIARPLTRSAAGPFVEQILSLAHSRAIVGLPVVPLWQIMIDEA